MCEMIRSVVDSNDDNESEDDEKFDLNKNMKINQDGEYYYSDGEDDIKSDEEDKV